MANLNAYVTLGNLTTYDAKIKAYVTNRDGKSYSLEQDSANPAKYNLKQSVVTAAGGVTDTVVGSITTASIMQSGQIVKDPAGLTAGTYLELLFADNTKVYVDVHDLAASGAASDITVSAISGMTATNVQAALAELKTELTSKDGGSYTLERVTDANYAASYKLKRTVGSSSSYVGDAINIPKDMVISGGSVGTCSLSNSPVAGLNVGDKYLDFTIANSTDHVYVSLAALVSASADKVTYSNATSGLTATNAQAAIDQVNTKVKTNTDKLDAIIDGLGAVTTRLQTILGTP